MDAREADGQAKKPTDADAGGAVGKPVGTRRAGTMRGQQMARTSGRADRNPMGAGAQGGGIRWRAGRGRADRNPTGAREADGQAKKPTGAGSADG